MEKVRTAEYRAGVWASHSRQYLERGEAGDGLSRIAEPDARGLLKQRRNRVHRKCAGEGNGSKRKADKKRMREANPYSHRVLAPRGKPQLKPRFRSRNDSKSKRKTNRRRTPAVSRCLARSGVRVDPLASFRALSADERAGGDDPRPLVYWFSEYARSTQVFFVIGGYVMARSMSGRNWDAPAIGRFIAQRYRRLGIPYLAAIVLAIAANAFGRGWLPEAVVGAPPTMPQLIAHVFFAQEIMGYQHLSAGLWFVCINFQLGLIYVAMLWIRDPVEGIRRFVPDRLPHNSRWDALTDFPVLFQKQIRLGLVGSLFLPVFLHGHRRPPGDEKRGGLAPMFWIYQLTVIAAMCYDWRWRLASALVVGLLLFGAEKSGLSTRWPRSKWIAHMGRTSYSLFLVHFPVPLLVSAFWARLRWTSAPAALAGLFLAFTASVAAAFVFHRFVEKPAAALARRS